MLRDLKSAFRELRKHPVFFCVAVLTLAIGIGAGTAIFGVVNRVLLNPLPYPNSDGIVELRIGSPRTPFGYPTTDYIARAWREGARSLDGVEAYAVRDLLAYDDSGARVVHGMAITPNLPTFLGVSPILGRTFSSADATAGAPAVALLSYAIWQRDYAGARDVLGRSIKLDDVSHVVIGVMPRGWDAIAYTTGDLQGDVWLPLRLDAAATAVPGFRAAEAIGRLRPGVANEDVARELDALAKNALEGAPVPIFGEDFATRVIPPSIAFIDSTMGIALRVLLGAAVLLLLVACSNVAGLLLARGASRAQELALRTALGASGWRLVRGLLADCIVLATTAGAAGLVVGWLALRGLVLLRPSNLDMLGDVPLDPTVLAFALATSAATIFLCGVWPASQLLSANIGAALRHGAAGVVRSGNGARVRKFLVGAQMAISVVLLVGAGLLVRSVVQLEHIDVGFDTTNLFSVQLSLPRSHYEQPASRDAFTEQAIERLRAIPGVGAVTEAFMAPPNYVMAGGGLEIRGVTLSDADARAAYAFNYVRPDFFITLGIRLLQGRAFTSNDQRSGPVLIVNRSAARRFWPEGNPIGTEVKLRGGWATVVGVVEDIAAAGRTGAPGAPLFYAPFSAEHAPTLIGALPRAVLLVRANSDPASVMGPIRSAISALDSEVAIPSMLLTDTAYGRTMDRPRFNMVLLSAFAVVALTLAAVGLSAVIGYEVAERTHEIGVRVALGARAGHIRRVAMRHGLAPAALGIACGVVGAFVAANLMAGLLYGVGPGDPVTFVGIVGALVVVATLSAWIPAQRATRIDPIVALRAD